MGDIADMIAKDTKSYGMHGYHLASWIHVCRHCGRKGLHWEQRKAGWRLCDGRGMHRCPVKSVALSPKSSGPGPLPTWHEDDIRWGDQSDNRDLCPNT